MHHKYQLAEQHVASPRLPAATPDKGQPPVATPKAYGQAVKVLFPVPVVLDQVDHSVTLAPTLESRNTRTTPWGSSILVIGWPMPASITILDSAGNKILPNRRFFTLHSLGAESSCVLLKPGRVIVGTPEWRPATQSPRKATTVVSCSCESRRAMSRCLRSGLQIVTDSKFVAPFTASIRMLHFLRRMSDATIQRGRFRQMEIRDTGEVGRGQVSLDRSFSHRT